MAELMADVSKPSDEALLEGLERAAFGYFLEAVNPGSYRRTRPNR